MVFHLWCAVCSALGGLPPVESTRGSIKSGNDNGEIVSLAGNEKYELIKTMFDVSTFNKTKYQ